MLTICTGRWTVNNGWTGFDDDYQDSDATLVFVFGASRLIREQAPFALLKDRFANSHLIGCSTAGEILNGSVDDDTLVAAAITFEHTALISARTDVTGKAGSYYAGLQLADALASDDLRAVFVLSDGQRVNGSELVRGLSEAVNADVVITGGLAGDGDRFQETWVLADGEPVSGIASAVGFYGDRLSYRHGTRAGWEKFGIERTVTRSDGNVLMELDGIPALDLYKLYLGDRALGLPASALLYPLALRSTATGEQVIRTVLNVDEASRSMIFAGDIPQGSMAQLMLANFDSLVEGAGQAAARARPDRPTCGPSLSIAISCIGRRLVLASRAEDELEATLDPECEHVTQIGFYSYGELSPNGAGTCVLHNQTMTITNISEY